MFYLSKTWEITRSVVLRRDHYECQKCKDKGKVTKATCVHHIKHLKDYPELALTLENLISLCDACHNEEHPEKFEEQNKKLNEKKKKLEKFKEKW